MIDREASFATLDQTFPSIPSGREMLKELAGNIARNPYVRGIGAFALSLPLMAQNPIPNETVKTITFTTEQIATVGGFVGGLTLGFISEGKEMHHAIQNGDTNKTGFRMVGEMLLNGLSCGLAGAAIIDLLYHHDTSTAGGYIAVGRNLGAIGQAGIVRLLTMDNFHKSRSEGSSQRGAQAKIERLLSEAVDGTSGSKKPNVAAKRQLKEMGITYTADPKGITYYIEGQEYRIR